MKRPILIVTIGYIIGIIWGLYTNFSIALLYIPIVIVSILFKKVYKSKRSFKLLSIKRYSRYLKLILKKQTIFLIIISSIISNSIVIFQNKKYENLYKSVKEIKAIAIVCGNKEEKEYKDVYEIKLKNNTKLYLQFRKGKYNLNYGDKIYITGEYIAPSVQRNYKGFNYKNYLKTLKIYGTVEAKSIEILEKNQGNKIKKYANDIFLNIKEKVEKILPEDESSIFLGLILGYTKNIDEEIKKDFRTSNIAHVLAISGMHVSYIIIGFTYFFKKCFGKRKSKIIVIVVLIIYMFITGFSPSVIRASIMAILLLISSLIYRKNDMWTSISFSILIILIYNPFLINNIGVKLSYGGTIGIILFQKNVLKIFESIKIRNKKMKYRINKKLLAIIDKIKEILSVTISAQLVLFPITIYHFATFGIYTFFTNIFLSLIIGPIIIISFVFIILLFINIKMASFFSIVINFSVRILILISKFGNLPFSKIYLSIPSVSFIIFYYISIILINILVNIYWDKNLNGTQRRIKNLLALAKYKMKQRKKIIFKILIFVIAIFIVLNLFSRELKINFLDVGQGDSTFIVTPNNKTILIDGGGNESSSFDVGEKILLPYILNRGYTKIDYMFISHFDQDHVRSGYYILCKK